MLPLSETVNDAMTAMYHALTTGNINWFKERVLYGPASIHIGTAPAYWMTSSQFLVELVRQFNEMNVEWRTGGMTFQEEGATAWAVDRPVVRFDDGSEIECRLSVIFSRASDRWQVAHSHLSIGAE
ncbi:MAG: SnoaL-like domain [Acidimicrobiia bacterium]|jgi:hypothetical protein|nr:SnoaL-like domain [Acidimicrobiia bacterium]